MPRREPTIGRRSGLGFWLLLPLLALLILTEPACAGKKKPGQGKVLGDEALFSRATEALEKGKLTRAREYFGELVALYPESPHFFEAKLGQADSYFLSGRAADYYEAISLYESFVSYYPLHERVCYARFQIAGCYHNLMERPDCDQKATHRAIDELLRVTNLCPESEYAAQAGGMLEECRARLAAHEYAVGFYYFRSGAFGAAAYRFKKILRERQYADFPEMPALHYYLAEALRRQDNIEESRIYFQQLLEKYPESSFARKAGRRLASLPAVPEPQAGG